MRGSDEKREQPPPLAAEHCFGYEKQCAQFDAPHQNHRVDEELRRNEREHDVGHGKKAQAFFHFVQKLHISIAALQACVVMQLDHG